MEKSKGHISFAGQYEYFRYGAEVRRAPVENRLDSRAGVRVGSRFFEYAAPFERYYSVEKLIADEEQDNV